MTAPAGTLDLTLPGDAVLRLQAGAADPWLAAARVVDARPGDITALAGTFATAGASMDQAWTRGGQAQQVIGGAFTNNGAPVLDLPGFLGALPVGFRDAGTRLAAGSTALSGVATGLATAQETVGRTVTTLEGDLQGIRAAWAAKVNAAGLIPDAEVAGWLAARDQQAAIMLDEVRTAGSTAVAAITAYEDVIRKAVGVFADQGFVDPAALGAPQAPAGGVDPATLGLPPGAGYAADPVNTGTGNFVEAETDLAFTGPLAGLSWVRVYNSRADTAGPFGRGWSSWLTTRLTVGAGGAHVEGPDGRRVFLARDQAGSFTPFDGLRLAATDTGFVLRRTDGSRWTFDPGGRVTGTWAGPGTAVAFVRDDTGRLVGLVHEGGRRVSLSWDADRPVAVGGGGRETAYTYEGGHLVAAGDRRYGIDLDGYLATVTDPDGVVEVVNTYDGTGRVLTQRTGFGRTVSFSYQPGGVTVVTDDTGGPANTYRHDRSGRLIGSVDGHGHTTAITRDAHGRVTAVIDRVGAVTTQEWDAAGRPVRRVPPSGIAETYTWDGEDRLTGLAVTGTAGGLLRTGYGYVGQERIPSEVTDPEGAVTRVDVAGGRVTAVTDPDGVTVRFAHDTDGLIVAVTDTLGATVTVDRDLAGRAVAVTTAAGRRTGYAYDPLGRVAERIDPDGAAWRFEHTAGGRLTAVTDPTGARTEHRHGDHGLPTDTVDPLGGVTALTYDPFGNLATVTGPDGAKTAYRHDALSRLAAWTDPAGGTWLREHDEEGRLAGSVDPTGVHTGATFDPAGRVTALDDGLTGSTFGYDEFGRATSHTRPDGTAVTGTYDRCGRLLTETDPTGGVTRRTYTPAGRLRRTVTPAGRVTTIVHDPAGRVAATASGPAADTSAEPGAGWWHHTYDPDGLPVTRTSPGGLSEHATYDACGRLVTRQAPGLGETRFEHDPAGRVIAAIDRAGRRTVTRDAAGHVVAATDALGHTTRYTRDPAGRVTAVTDPLGGRWHISYDACGRITGVTDPLGHTTHYSHDPAGRVVERRDATGGVVRWTRDTSGRVTAIGGDLAITIHRDQLGRPVRITEPGVPTIELGYDRAGRLTRRRSGDRELGWTYDPDGLPVGLTHPDGHSTIRHRDGAGRVVALTHPLLGRIELLRDPDGRLVDLRAGGLRRSWAHHDGTLAGYQIGDRVTRIHRDRNGRVTTLDDGDTRRHYSYDEAGQLVAADDRTFTYDPCGRLSTEAGPGGRRRHFTYDAAGRLTRAGDQEYVYDEAGRRTAGGGHLYHYDPLDRLTAIDTGDRRTELTVDALGELVDAGGTPLLWDTADPLSPLVGIGDRSLIGDGHPWAATHPTTVLAPDWQHSIGATPTADPWGGAGDGPAPGYRGELALDGHVWLRHRIYDPATRAFTTPDPLPPVPGTAYSGNPYHYAGNDPLNRIDPLGLRPMTDTDVAAQHHDDGGLFGGIGDWWHDNWQYVAGGAMAVAGVGLMFTGVGGAAGVALLAASGGLLAAGTDTIVQKATTGTVDWNEVGEQGLIGTATGAAGGALTAGIARYAQLGTVLDPAVTASPRATNALLSPSRAAEDLITTGKTAAPGGSVGSDEILYHGTAVRHADNIRENGINLGIQRADSDFGRGFYVTRDRAQAEIWMDQRFPTEPREVMEFRVKGSDMASLNGKVFDGPTAEYQDMVRTMRSGSGPMHSYDWVEGPLLRNPEEFLQGDDIVTNGHQISFHTQPGLDLLQGGMQ